MHARVTSGRVTPERASEAKATYRESIVPAVKRQPGFKGAYLLGDPERTGRFIPINFWDAEFSRNATESSGYYKEQRGKVAATSAEQPRMEHYEPSVSELA